MKKRSYLIAAGCTVVLYALSACSDHAANDTAQAGNPETMSVAEARRYFERVAAPTRAGSEEGTLTLGTYMPDWSLATVSAGEVLSSTDVPVRGEFRYFRYRIDEYGEPRFTPIYHKLVVVKDSRSGVMSSYLRFYVPDPDYAAGRTADDYDRLLNSGSKGDFTGLAVYTSLDGFPVHAVRYAGGACQAEAFLYDKSRTQAENTARLGEMLDGLSVVCSRETAVTRAEAEAEKSEPVDGGGIEAIVVSAKHPVNHIKYERPDTDPVKPTEEDRGPSGSGGGGGGASSNPGSPAGKRKYNACFRQQGKTGTVAGFVAPGLHGREDYRFNPGECNDPHRFFRKFGDDSDCLYFRRRCRMGRFRDQDGVSARRYHFARRAFPYAPMFGQNPRRVQRHAAQ